VLEAAVVAMHCQSFGDLTMSFIQPACGPKQ
jgi:hypothetical protein